MGYRSEEEDFEEQFCGRFEEGCSSSHPTIILNFEETKDEEAISHIHNWFHLRNQEKQPTHLEPKCTN